LAKKQPFSAYPQKPSKMAKKGLFWGFLKYMVNRPTFLPSANPA
jgi:hypothetical protein